MICARVYDRQLYWNGLWRKRNYPFALNLVPNLVAFDRLGKIGPVVLDLGCSCNPVTNWLNVLNHKRILLDISEDVHDLSELADSPLTVSCDLCEFERDTKSFRAFEKTLRKSGEAGLDAIVSADNLINYIPWRPVFKTLDTYLKDNGLVFLCFGVNVGRGEAFHPERPTAPASVLFFFRDELGYRMKDYGSQKGCHGIVFQKYPFSD